MRRILPLLVAALAVSVTACGDSSDSAATTVATTTGDSTSTTAPATTTTVDPAACVDATVATDPADYPADKQPTAIRPCVQPTELTVTVLRPGSGREAVVGDTLYMDYYGIRSEDGMRFDDSYSRGEPFTFALGTGRVIAGWDEGLLGAQAGSLIRLDIPTELAYADTPRGDIIKPGDALTFLAEVRAVVRPTTTDDAPLDLVVDTSEGATGTTTRDVRVGDGDVAHEGQTALVHLMLVRGDNRVVLEQTWERGTPAPIVLTEDSGTLVGLVKGIQGMAVGGMRVITMPPADAFGESGQINIGLPGDVDVIAVIELMGLYGTPTADSANTTVPNVVATTTPKPSTTTTTTIVDTTIPGTVPGSTPGSTPGSAPVDGTTTTVAATDTTTTTSG